MEKKRVGFSAVVLGIGLALTIVAGLFSPADKTGQPYSLEVEPTQPSEPVTTEAAEPEFLTKEQDALLKQLLELMKSDDLAGAASAMEVHKPELSKLLEETFMGQRFLYNEEGIADSVDGRGIVLTSTSTLFYGIFQDGTPEGIGVALQGIVLEEPRYDYAIGSWSKGKLNGYGTSGYTYYKGTGEGDGFKTEKSGTFRDDLMEGELRYTSINNEGNSITWNIAASAGVTQLDDRWTYKESKNEYQLLAENDNSHAYLLKEAEAETAIWVNRITWNK